MNWKFWEWAKDRRDARERAIAQAVLEAVADMESRVANLERAVLKVSRAPSVDDILEEAADHNREHAHEKFGDSLFSRDGEWFEIESGKPVVFTPYGWRLAEDVVTYITGNDFISVPDQPYVADEQIDFGGWEDR